MGAALIFLAVGALYLWTALSSPDGGRSYHSLLAESFANGRTDLLIDPAPELLALADPYDPAQNAPYRLHDATLYEGRYYLYFGPAPAALVFLPLRAVGVDPGDRWAAPLLAWGGFGLFAVLLLFLIARYVPRTPTAWRLVAVAGLGLTNVVPFLLRRPAVYETSIAAAYLFMAATALLLVAGSLRERPSARMIALGSLTMGLAVASRSSMIFLVPLLVWAWLRALGPRSGWTRATLLRWTAAAASPLAACLVLLGIYNAVRFGSLTEFGTSYQLAGVNTRTFDFFSVDRLVPGAWFYFLAPPHFGLDFPFITLRPEYPGTLPAGFFVEPVAGILPVTPLLFVLLALPLLARGRGPRFREAIVLGGVLVGISIALPLVPVLALGGATERYGVDFASLIILVVTIVWLALADGFRTRRWARRTTLAAGAGAIAFSATAGLAFGLVGYYDGLRVAQPGTYERLEGIFGFVPTFAAHLQGEPVILEVSPPAGTPTAESRVQLAAPGAGEVTIRANVVAAQALPAATVVTAGAAGPDGRRRSARATVGGVVTVRAGLDGAGLANVTIRWIAARSGPASSVDPVASGVGITGVHVVRWTPE